MTRVDTRAPKVGRPGTIGLRVSCRKDYEILGKVIRKGDAVETVIRLREEGKGRSGAGKRNTVYMNAIVRVDAVRPGDEAIELTGPYESRGSQKGGYAKTWLIDGTDLKLTKSCWTEDDIELLRGGGADHHRPDIRNCDRAIAEFHELLTGDCNMLTFGEQATLYALDVGAVKTLIIARQCLDRQSPIRRQQLTDSTGSFRGADIIIVPVESPSYPEMMQLGGITAVLKYAFDPTACQ